MDKAVYLNKEYVLIFEDDKVVVKDIAKYDGFVGSIIPFSNILSYSFKLPKTYTEEQIKGESEIKVYEEAGLDLSKKYKIIYIQRELKQEDSIFIEAVAIEEESIKEIFADRIDKVKYIDYLTPDFLLFTEFYSLKEIEPKRDAFVYLDKVSSFVAIYENGEYLYSKSLNSLNPLLKGLSLGYDEFVDFMKEKGLDKESYKEEELSKHEIIDRYFSEFFMKINNILMYGRSIFYLEAIDNIYFYTPFEIKHIDSFKDFWDLSGVSFQRLVIDEELDVNQLSLLGLYYFKHLEDKEKYNLTIFYRPPPIYKTETFKFVVFMIIVILLFVGDYMYRSSVETKLKSDIAKLSKIYKKKKNGAAIEKLQYEALQDKYDATLKVKEGINKKIHFFTDSLKFANKVLKESKFSNDFVLISKLLGDNKLRILSISKIDKNITVVVYTSKRNRNSVGKFMKDLLDNGFLSVKTKEISVQNNNYVSEVDIIK